jgi:hypothetical protein
MAVATAPRVVGIDLSPVFTASVVSAVGLGFATQTFDQPIEDSLRLVAAGGERAGR